MNWVVDNLGLIAQLTGEHLRHSLVPIVLGLAISLPLGWLAFRVRAVHGVILVVTGLLYTLPSLALLPLLPVIFGFSALSEANLVVALTIYALAILVRSVADGLDSVPAETRDAASAIGYGEVRRFFGVELPLAAPVILAGLRVTAVSTVSLATVGILIGVTNLGYLFTNGFQRRIIPEILAGVVAVALVALAVDLVLQLAGRLLMPWTRRVGSLAKAGA